MFLNRPEDQIYIRSEVNGKLIKVSAILTSSEEANQYLESSDDEGVIYHIEDSMVEEELVFLAKKKDLGKHQEEMQSLLKQLYLHHKSQAKGHTSPVSKIYHAELMDKIKKVMEVN